MRCKNCGWENPDGQVECEKCHSILTDINSSHNGTAPISKRMQGTISENICFNEPSPVSIPKTCPRCGYPISDTSTNCPNCNYELKPNATAKQTITCKICGAEIAPGGKYCSSCGAPIGESVPQTYRIQRQNIGTIIGGPIMSPTSKNRFCTLKPIAWEGENVNYNPITYSGETIILNRANTDANNNSITSREQAIITCEDGDWFIENKSELKTTFIRVNGRVKLTNGDIIILGNREFEFNGR